MNPAKRSPWGVYYEESYWHAAVLLEPSSQLLVFRHGRAIVPLVVRPLPDGVGFGFDAISPYDFSGPLLNGESASEVWSVLQTWAVDHHIMTAFFRFHPFASRPDHWAGLDGLDIRQVAWNVVIDLADEHSLLSQCKRTVQRDLKVARRERVTCRLNPVTARGLDEFVPIYEATMTLRRAAAFYHFPRRFFDALERDCSDRCALALATMNGQTVAGAFILLDRPTAYYYLACSSSIGRKVCAMNMLVHDVARMLCERGFERFHLGGGNTGLLAFKERFGPGRVPYFIGRAVFDPMRYDELRRGRKTDYFPAYRDASCGADMSAVSLT